IYANWQIKTYTVTFKDINGIVVQNITVEHGSSVTQPTVESIDGYTFSGWKNTSTGKLYNNEGITGYTVFVATYNGNKYTITYVLNGGVNASDNPEEYTCGKGASFNAPARRGYIFQGWYETEDLSGTAINNFSTYRFGDVVLYAAWEVNTCTHPAEYVSYDVSTGTHRFSCSLCGESYTEDHDFCIADASAAHLYKAATCTAPAEYYYSCACGKNGTVKFTYGEPAPHSYVETAEYRYLAARATVSSKAVYYKHCEVCGHVGTETFEYGEYQVKPDLATIIGLGATRGSNGNFYLVVRQAKTWHAARDYCESLGGHLATITSEEEDDLCYSLYIKANVKGCYFGLINEAYDNQTWTWITGEEFSYSNWQANEPDSVRQNVGQYWMRVKGWDDEFNYANDNYFLCEWEAADLPELIVTVTAPTCTEQGYTTYTCKDGGDSYVSDYVEALGHDLIHHSGKAATCTESGWNAYDTCSRCDYTTYQQVPSVGHNYTAVVTQPTCTEKGYTTHTCSGCGDSYVDSYVDALGHDLIHHSGKAATCTESGWNAYDTCSRCDYTTYQQ
ncbi:MAG: InlB B-repeat-containing protein, partial [Paludibacteraceae bacterium]|nr:InlB B-repeat-containing protein [Paludibacteraceae bacterium]